MQCSRSSRRRADCDFCCTGKLNLTNVPRKHVWTRDCLVIQTPLSQIMPEDVTNILLSQALPNTTPSKLGLFRNAASVLCVDGHLLPSTPAPQAWMLAACKFRWVIAMSTTYLVRQHTHKAVQGRLCSVRELFILQVSAALLSFDADGILLQDPQNFGPAPKLEMHSVLQYEVSSYKYCLIQ